eukprot:jgi/Orpsp1_1/1184366/evm.model.c7180000089242.2
MLFYHYNFLINKIRSRLSGMRRRNRRNRRNERNKKQLKTQEELDAEMDTYMKVDNVNVQPQTNLEGNNTTSTVVA